jgi:hypothetical protein
MPPSNSIAVALFRCLRLPALAALGCAAGLHGQTALIANSPFAPVGAAAGPAGKAPAEAFELAGATAQGSQVTVCILERKRKHSEWIPVGGESNGIHVISYDAAHDTAVVTIGGERKQLVMQKAVVVSTNPTVGGRAPAPVPATSAPVVAASSAAPDAPAGPSNPATAARDQREARMLVSDLLEIGVQQRKAYQDARQRPAAATPPPQN